MKSVEGTPEEHPGALTNNNGSLSCKIPPEKTSIFRSTRFFMVVFLSGWVMQGMYMTYFVSEITTIEKLFQIESKTTGVLLAATEIGQICTSLFLTYFAGRGHRPRWIALMMLVLALGVLGCVVPHIMYGTALLNARSHNTTAEALCSMEEPMDHCKADAITKQEEYSSITAVVMPWFFVCLLITGVGQTGIATLGIPYIDDNVGSRQSPLYMAITIGVRLIGPAMGFVLGSLCSRVYVQPSSPPPYGPSDPRWVGAWWLGMVIISTVIMSLAMFMLCFPKQIKKDPNAAQVKLKYEREKAKPRQSFFADFFATIKRQLTNDILMCRTASSVLHLMPISGLYIFLPKYLETQFKLASYEANLVTGIGGIFITGVAIVVSGIVILKFVPTARQVAAWTAATAFLYAAGMILLMFVSCPTEDFAGLRTSTGAGYLANMPSNNMLPVSPPCVSTCRCENSKYNAICGQDGHTYFSACHAGCHNVKKMGDKVIYYNCECIDNNRTIEQFDTLNSSTVNMLNDEEFDSNWGYANGGYCHGNCNQLYLFIVIFSLVMCIHASGEVGSVLLIIRCTDAKDKAIAMGVIQFAIGVFGNVPCPIIFGAVVDSACMFWDKTMCDGKGACFHYNMDQFRHFFLGLTAGIMFLAFIMDLFVWHKASRIDINPEDHQQNPIGPDASTEPLVTSQDPVLVPLTSRPTDTQV